MRSNARLQNILLPDGNEFEGAQVLFFRSGISKERDIDRLMPEYRLWDFKMCNGEKVLVDNYPDAPNGEDVEGEVQALYDEERKCVVVNPGGIADFSCYLNMCSANKWFKLTYADEITLKLDVQGVGAVHVVTYRLPDFKTEKDIGKYIGIRESYVLELQGKPRPKNLSKKVPLEVDVIESVAFSADSRSQVSVPLSHPDATLIGFMVEALDGDVCVYGGGWDASVESDACREVQICIATTTFQNERYITHNIQAMKQMVSRDSEMADHFQMIVVDNGQTLVPADLEDSHVHVFPNINVGGAGGFARGMIESLKLEKRPTHLLIMDDDVLILPESIKRTYVLLSLLRPEYWDHYISGAMLRMEEKTIQHEDIGYVRKYGWFAPKKPSHTLKTIYDCAINDVNWPDLGFEYAAWWYCCVPMKFVTEETLPVPVFIRGDDVEFSLRNKAKMISMNGICVWHVGFGSKFSAQMEYYQVVRNSFILQAFHEHTSRIDFRDRVVVLFNELTCSFAYDYADLLLDALEDFLDGPAILEQPNGIDIIKEKGKKNERMLPFSEVWDEDFDINGMFQSLEYDPFKVLERKFITFTRNGQQHVKTPGTQTGFIPYDWGYVFDFVYDCNQLLSINPKNGTAALRKKDPVRFNEVKERYDELMKRYKREKAHVEQEWRRAYPRFTSIAFWNEYLGLA